ncbi:hypothetical protein D3C75_653880 [compost metagenome]
MALGNFDGHRVCKREKRVIEEIEKGQNKHNHPKICGSCQDECSNQLSGQENGHDFFDGAQPVADHAPEQIGQNGDQRPYGIQDSDLRAAEAEMRVE